MPENLHYPIKFLPKNRVFVRRLTELRSQEDAAHSYFTLLRESIVFKEFLEFAFLKFPKSKSRHFTDLIVAFFLGHSKRFLEIGASHPEICSDTYLLEKEFEWSGVQVEPDPRMARKLRLERSADVLEVAIVGTGSTKQVGLNGNSGGLSRFVGDKVTSMDFGHLIDLKGTSFDALFIDIEGGELNVLNHEKFRALGFEFLSIERIWNSEAINVKLESLGYVNFWSKISGYESWWVKNPQDLGLIKGLDYGI